MNYQTTNHILWPYDQKSEPTDRCDCCNTKLEWYEVEDNCNINGMTLCDLCASDLQAV